MCVGYEVSACSRTSFSELGLREGGGPLNRPETFTLAGDGRATCLTSCLVEMTLKGPWGRGVDESRGAEWNSGSPETPRPHPWNPWMFPYVAKGAS